MDDTPMVVGSMLALWRLLWCVHPQDNAAKIDLVVHTPWTLAADTEAVTEAVELPHSAPRTPVQGQHQVSGYRIVTDSGGSDPVGGV